MIVALRCQIGLSFFASKAAREVPIIQLPASGSGLWL
jgi:hypothetical protein